MMKNMKDITIKAQLANGKCIVIDPPEGSTVGWRCATQYEIDNDTVQTFGIFNWQTAKVQTTFRYGRKVWFITIDDTNVILNSYFE